MPRKTLELRARNLKDIFILGSFLAPDDSFRAAMIKWRQPKIYFQLPKTFSSVYSVTVLFEQEFLTKPPHLHEDKTSKETAYILYFVCIFFQQNVHTISSNKTQKLTNTKSKAPYSSQRAKIVQLAKKDSIFYISLMAPDWIDFNSNNWNRVLKCVFVCVCKKRERERREIESRERKGEKENTYFIINISINIRCTYGGGYIFSC